MRRNWIVGRSAGCSRIFRRFLAYRGPRHAHGTGYLTKDLLITARGDAIEEDRQSRRNRRLFSGGSRVFRQTRAD